MIRADIDITLTLAGPFITQSSAPGHWGLDATLARNANNTPYISAAHITGKLRQAWEELAVALVKQGSTLDQVPNAEEIRNLLGVEADDVRRTARPKQILFSDFALSGNNKTEGIRYRIRIDPERGAVKDHAQLMLESPFASGEAICFTGQASFLVESEQKAERIQEQVRTGLQWVTQLGAFRSQGFGRLEDAEVIDLKITHPENNVADAAQVESLDLVIKPEAPFCVDAATSSGNLFKSSEIIPGGVILGCLAGMLKMADGDYQTLSNNLKHLRIRHAFPSAECMTRPVAMPLSLAQSGKKYWDLALERRPRLIDDQAPVFKPDWKNDGPKAQFGWPDLERELRVRTAIDSEHLRARDEQLFSYDMVRPDGACWLSRINLVEVPERERDETAQQLRALLSLGLMGFGKAKTIARAEPLAGGSIRPNRPINNTKARQGEADLVCLTLQTDALLLDPGDLDETSGQKKLLEAYQNTWGRLTDALELQHFYAQQFLAGGEFLARRYWRWGSPDQGDEYYPWILTRAGSVFVFSINDQDGATTALKDWLQNGLPLAGNITDAYGIRDESADQWQDCPYVPHNGYGEIAVNLDIHEAWRPKGDEKIQVIEEIGQ
ncbi:hypothetical protein DJ031_15340 [bacterium endosymbiont of Escarpia laminata]|nr:MAG: hypothetical protein DJ031_15340 [bacterium endosymbiont of Escarpia laminata]